MNATPPVDTAKLAKALLRVADIVQGATERFGIYRDGRARIGERVVLYAMFDLDPAGYFAPENREMALWQTSWRQTRRDGSRDHYKALHDAMRDTLTGELPGDWRMGDLYTPDQIRDVAHRIALAA